MVFRLCQTQVPCEVWGAVEWPLVGVGSGGDVEMNVMRLCWGASVGLCLVTLMACGGETSESSAPVNNGGVSNNGATPNNVPGDPDVDNNEDAPPSSVTYHRDIRPLMERHCVTCHQDGGAGPFPLGYDPQEWAEGPAWWTQVSVAAIESGTMPPWSADTDCRPVRLDRSMPDAERARFVQWQEAGFPEGDEGDYVAPQEVVAEDIGSPTLLVDAGEAYQPDRAAPDDFQCLIMDYTFERETFIEGIHVIPDKTEVVHHALVYLIPPEEVAAAEALDAADPDAGYSCFGGPGLASRRLLIVWIPGTEPLLYGDNAAFPVPAGSKIVMETHYNTLFLPGDEPAPADQTQVALWTMPQGETPERELLIVAGAHVGLSIDPDDPRSVQQRAFPLRTSARVIGVVPHMHLLGTEISASIEHDDGSESCLIDVKRWDYNWQQTYLFPPEDYVEVRPGDRHALTCVYDNSVTNQPVINGERVDPKEVSWGEGTLDEMCLNFLIATVPYNDGDVEDDGPVMAGCGEFQVCFEGCEPEDDACRTRCFLAGGAGCATCNLEALRECGDRHCAPALGAVLQCLDECEVDNALVCLNGECAEVTGALYDCVEPRMLEGECNDTFEVCGVSF